MTQTLITRRDKVVATWLNQVCPVVDPVLGNDGAFTFTQRRGRRARRRAGRRAISFSGSASTTPPPRARRSASAQTIAGAVGPRAGRAPRLGRVRGRRGHGVHPQHPGWARPATFFFRRAAPRAGRWSASSAADPLSGLTSDQTRVAGIRLQADFKPAKAGSPVRSEQCAYAVPAIEFDRVSHDFVTPDGRTYRAIDEVSLAIPAGAFVALVGPSGCGKSTLLNLAAGLLTPSSGRVRVDGDGPRRSQSPRHLHVSAGRAAAVEERPRQCRPRADARRGVAERTPHARADEWLARVGLSAFASHYPSQLSGGMRKRVAIAQNWILDRSQVLMDEPFSALDVHTRQLMETELLSLWDVPPSIGAAAAAARVRLRHARPRRGDRSGRRGHRLVRRARQPRRRPAPVGLARPRDLFELRTADAFVDSIGRSGPSCARK